MTPAPEPTDNPLRLPTASVVICAHTLDRLELTLRCVAGILDGSVQPDKIVVVIDNNAALEEALTAKLPPGAAALIANSGHGAAAARNTGVLHCDSDIVAFIDDDACPEEHWLAALQTAMHDPDLVGAGGLILPDWESPDATLPPELLWVVGSTYAGHPTQSVPITRPIGANMVVRREAFLAVGGFPVEFGPSGGKKTSSNEELALYTLLRQLAGPDSVLYVPSAVVRHYAPTRRTRASYVFSRSYVEGTSKAAARRLHGGTLMAHDANYVRSTLLPAITRYIWRSITGPAAMRASHLRSASLCTLSLLMAAIGYCRELIF